MKGVLPTPFRLLMSNAVVYLCPSSIILHWSGIRTFLVFPVALSLQSILLKWPCNALSGWAGLTDWNFCSREESFSPFSPFLALHFSPFSPSRHSNPTSLLHSLDDPLLESEMLQLTDPHSRYKSRGGTLFYWDLNASPVWEEMAALDLSPKPIFLCVYRILSELPVILMRPFLGKNNRRAKAVSPPTHRPFVQTDSSRPFGLSKWAFFPSSSSPTFLCLEPMFAPRA